MRPENNENDIAGAMYREEINSLRIEKLGNRITIISILLPCIIGIVLFFAYMNLQERVVNIHNTGQNEVKTILNNLETKINAMIVDLAKVHHLLDIELPKLKKTGDSLEARLIRLDSRKADKAYVQSYKKKIQTELGLFKERIANNKNQYEKMFNLINRTKKQIFSAMDETNARSKKNMEKIQLSLKETMAALKTSIQKNLAQFNLINKKIAAVQKNIKFDREQNKTLLKEKIGRKEISARLKAFKKAYDTKIATLLSGRYVQKKMMKKSLQGIKAKSTTIHKKAAPVSKSAKTIHKNTIKSTRSTINSGKIIEENLSE